MCGTESRKRLNMCDYSRNYESWSAGQEKMRGTSTLHLDVLSIPHRGENAKPLRWDDWLQKQNLLCDSNGFPDVSNTLGQQYNVGEKPTVLHKPPERVKTK